MASYDVTFARSARKELQALSRALQERVFRRIEALATNPRRKGPTIFGAFGLAITESTTPSLMRVDTSTSAPFATDPKGTAEPRCLTARWSGRTRVSRPVLEERTGRATRRAADAQRWVDWRTSNG
jgi:hypothetical protein